MNLEPELENELTNEPVARWSDIYWVPAAGYKLMIIKMIIKIKFENHWLDSNELRILAVVLYKG